MRLVFAGTPEAALPSLRLLLDTPRHEVAAVLTRPDKPAGRGRRPAPSPVRRVAEEAGLEVLAPARLRDPGFLDRLRQIAPDAAPVVAFGGLIPPEALEIPRHGWINLHFSVLPAWRGAAPVQRAILAGDELTGATTFRIEEDLDTGPVYGVLTTPIGPRETAGELTARLAREGARLLLDTLDGIEAGALTPRPQPPDGVSYAAKVTVDDARIDWHHPAIAIDRQVRACTPVPGAWTTFRGGRLGIGPVQPLAEADGLAPGQVRAGRAEVRVGAGAGAVVLGKVRPAGRPAMPAVDWARGARLGVGDRLE